jgi:hypothetical protein
MDGTGADDHQHAVVRAVEDATTSLAAGAFTWHSWPHTQGSGAIPVPQIRFDYDLSTPGSQSWDYNLQGKPSWTQDCSSAKRYYFSQYEPGGLDLYDPDKEAPRPRAKRRGRQVTVGIP